MTRFSIAVSQRVLDSEQENDTLNDYALRVATCVRCCIEKIALTNRSLQRQVQRIYCRSGAKNYDRRRSTRKFTTLLHRAPISFSFSSHQNSNLCFLENSWKGSALLYVKLKLNARYIFKQQFFYPTTQNSVVHFLTNIYFSLSISNLSREIRVYINPRADFPSCRAPINKTISRQLVPRNP